MLLIECISWDVGLYFPLHSARICAYARPLSRFAVLISSQILSNTFNKVNEDAAAEVRNVLSAGN